MTTRVVSGRTMRRGAVAAACIAATLGASGCFGSDSSSSSSSSSAGAKALPHAELVRRADSACAAALKRLAALPTPGTIDELAGYATRVHDIGEQLDTTIGGLHATQADAPRLQTYQVALHNATEATQELAQAAKRGDRDFVRSASDRIASAGLGALAAQAGFAQCATAGTFGS